MSRRARADGLHRAAAMVPRGEWGERVYKAFRDLIYESGRFFSKAQNNNAHTLLRTADH